MTPKKAEQILDKLGIEYEKVSMAHTLIIKFKDGNRVSFKKFLRDRELHLKDEVREILYKPQETSGRLEIPSEGYKHSNFEVQEVIIEDINPERHIETEIIKKTKKKNNK